MSISPWHILRLNDSNSESSHWNSCIHRTTMYQHINNFHFTTPSNSLLFSYLKNHLFSKSSLTSQAVVSQDPAIPTGSNLPRTPDTTSHSLLQPTKLNFSPIIFSNVLNFPLSAIDQPICATPSCRKPQFKPSIDGISPEVGPAKYF